VIQSSSGGSEALGAATIYQNDASGIVLVKSQLTGGGDPPLFGSGRQQQGTDLATA
jgi:hypothetical protein